MTDIIKFNEAHTPKTEIGMRKFELAEALNMITDLQNPHQAKKYTPEQRYHLFNKSMRKVLDILDIDLDIHEMMKTGAEGFSYSDTEDDTQALEKVLSHEKRHTDQPQASVKSIVKILQEISARPWEYAGEDMDVLGDIVYSYVSDLCNALGYDIEEDSVTPTIQEPSEDNLNMEMLAKLHEVQDHILKSGQDAVSMNQVQTAISILEGSLGVMGKVEE